MQRESLKQFNVQLFILQAGLASCLLAKLGAPRIVVTDGLPDVVNLARANVAANLSKAGSQDIKAGVVSLVGLSL